MEHTTDVQIWIDRVLVDLGMSQEQAQDIDKWIIFAGIIVIALTINIILRLFVLRVVKNLVRKTKVKWDDVLFDNNVMKCLCNIVTPVMIAAMLPMAFGTQTDDPEVIYTIIVKLLDIYLVINCLLFVNSLMKALFSLAAQRPSWEGKPIKGLLQMAQVLLICVGIILVVSILLDKSPVILLTGLGASAAVLMLIFQNSILGLVAGVQLSANNMLKVGDWISMPKHNIDGVVTEISLTTVKIRAWDNTVQTIPPNLLVNETFDNWQPMFERGGRRIKRSINIDTRSIKFADSAFMERIVADEVTGKMVKSITSETAEGETITNLDLFMRAVNAYLDNHPRINHNMMVMVRQLQPTQWGLPIEFYCFSANVNWVPYEWLQSEVISHVIALAPKFDLVIYQAPSSKDKEESFNVLSANR